MDASADRRVDAGAVIPVRTNESIDVDRQENLVYHGTVDQDIRDHDGRLVIPRGASVELYVRVAEPNGIEAQREQSFVGSIVGALGGKVRGTAVHVPRDSVVTFRLERPLYVGVADRGVDRDGHTITMTAITTIATETIAKPDASAFAPWHGADTARARECSSRSRTERDS